ncbi:hypothetical protein SUDANB23_01738 [Streptomyces sp. enrichment culture]
MGEVLRPREGERPFSATRGTRPNHRRSPPSDNHWSRLTRITHNPAGQASPDGRRPPCPRSDVIAGAPARWGPRSSRRPTGCRGTGDGPSVADRGAFSPPAQGGSLLASNGRITVARPAGPERRRWVHWWGCANQLISGQNPTDQRLRLTRSNSGRDYQDLAKRGRFGLCRPDGTSGPVRHRNGRKRQNGRPGAVRSEHFAQNRARARARRAVTTAGWSAPTTSNSSSSRTRAVSRSSPAVRATVSTSRPKASST